MAKKYEIRLKSSDFENQRFVAQMVDPARAHAALCRTAHVRLASAYGSHDVGSGP